jgi:hypothetical protein
MLRWIHSSSRGRRIPSSSSQFLAPRRVVVNPTNYGFDFSSFSTLDPINLSYNSLRLGHSLAPVHENNHRQREQQQQRDEVIKSFLLSLHHAAVNSFVLPTSRYVNSGKKNLKGNINSSSIGPPQSSFSSSSLSTSSSAAVWTPSRDDEENDKGLDVDQLSSMVAVATDAIPTPVLLPVGTLDAEPSMTEEGSTTPDTTAKDGATDAVTTMEKTAKVDVTTASTATNARGNQDMQLYLLENRLATATKNGNLALALRLLDKAQSDGVWVAQNLVSALFFAIVDEDVFEAYKVLQYYNRHPHTRGRRPAMYRRICKAVELVDPKVHYRANIHAFIESLLNEMDALGDVEVQQQGYPKLVVSLVSQKSVSVGAYAHMVYDYMMEKKFPLSEGYLLTLLALSKYNRQADLPFHDILARLAAVGRRPFPPIALKAVQNMFPYTNADATTIALQAILDYQRNKQQDDVLPTETGENDIVEESSSSSSSSSMRGEVNHQKKQLPESSPFCPVYNIDLGTLEAMSASAARSGHSKLIFVIWEVMEALGYKPTEAIYENSIIAFASHRNTLCNAFAAVEAMKADGFQVSRALIRSISHAIRYVYSNCGGWNSGFGGVLHLFLRSGS